MNSYIKTLKWYVHASKCGNNRKPECKYSSYRKRMCTPYDCPMLKTTTKKV